MVLNTLQSVPQDLAEILTKLERRHQDECDTLLLKAGLDVFRAACNGATYCVQFRRDGLYSTEDETLEWFRNLGVEGVRAYGVFGRLPINTGDGDFDLRFVPPDRDDPFVNDLSFLGWYFTRSEDEPHATLFQLGLRFSALNGFDRMLFAPETVRASTYRRTTGRKWAATSRQVL